MFMSLKAKEIACTICNNTAIKAIWLTLTGGAQTEIDKLAQDFKRRAAELAELDAIAAELDALIKLTQEAREAYVAYDWERFDAIPSELQPRAEAAGQQELSDLIGQLQYEW